MVRVLLLVSGRKGFTGVRGALLDSKGGGATGHKHSFAGQLLAVVRFSKSKSNLTIEQCSVEVVFTTVSRGPVGQWVHSRFLRTMDLLLSADEIVHGTARRAFEGAG